MPSVYKILAPEILDFEALMRRLNWTGQDLCNHLDVDKNTVTNWRKGHVRIPKVVLLYLRLLLRTHEQSISRPPSTANHGAVGTGEVV